ncbi:MAG: sel1 repeat family protein [Ruminococcaceae bacterium]|nr:sel1 repeat family protein [Oscillospiraceae bacterium]
MITSEQLREKLNELLQKPNANTNTVFMDTMHFINTKAQGRGYANGIAWVRAATAVGELTTDELTEFENCHPLRNLLGHGGASEITISESRCIFVLRILFKIEQSKLSADGTSAQEYPTEKATPEEIEEWYLKGKAHYERNEYEEAVAYYRKAAAQGDFRAQNNLGTCYEQGLGISKDEGKAVYWYRKSADQGNSAAQINLANCYLSGKGVAKDWTMAVSLYQKSAEQNHAIGQRALALCYQFGKGIKKDDKEAAQWYEKAAMQDYAPAMANIGDCYYNGIGVAKNYEKALFWYKKGAEQGDAGCIRGLGDCYYDGCGVKQDYQQAVQYYRSAADRQDAFAQGNLAFCYIRGHGVKENYAVASEWYRYAESAFEAALSNGSPEEYYIYAMFLRKGRFVPNNNGNRDSIKNWLLKAANQGHPRAIIVLGKECMDKIPRSEANYIQARQWFRKAAEAGSAEAMYYMGLSYSYDGSTSTDNWIESGKWYLKAAIWGYDDVIFKNKYAIDTFMKRNLTPELVDEMRRASNQGIAQASKLLSICYENGYCVEQNIQQKYRYTQLAAQQGDGESQRIIAMADWPTNSEETSKQNSKDTKAAKAEKEASKTNLLLRAAENGDTIAQYQIACAYAQGKGMKKDAQEAFKWYLKAAKGSHYKACYEVALCYENGIGVKRNMNEAIPYYHLALLADISEKEKAQINYKIGKNYYDGDGIKVMHPYTAAIPYLKKAAKMGHQQAKEALGYVRFKSFFEKFKK